MVRPTAEAKGINIETHFDSQPTMVPGDANRLQQVVWNLLANAIKFTPSGGVIQNQDQSFGFVCRDQVSDNGQGISPEFLPFVFDRFRQADSTTTRRHGGLGLGLAIVRHLVEIHGGTALAESPGPEKGATFTVRLPVVNSRTSRGLNNAQPEFECMNLDYIPALSGLYVLLVDDDNDTLQMIARGALRGRGERHLGAVRRSGNCAPQGVAT